MTQADKALRINATQSQISRNIKPFFPKYTRQVKLRIQKLLLEIILNEAKRWHLLENPESPDYLDNLNNEIEVFIDNVIFSNIDEKVRDSRTRQMNSLYFQRLSIYLSQYHVVDLA